MAKGSDFEREICKDLSRWWTCSDRDDVFWRTAMSGGRATVRARQGKTTAGSYGDITAIDPIGAPFLKAFALELKRGYNRDTLHDIVDCSPTAKQPTIVKWIEQAHASRKLSKSFHWMIIHRRDRRQPMVYMPKAAMMYLLKQANQHMTNGMGIVAMPSHVKYEHKKKRHIGFMLLEDFFTTISPKHVRELIETGNVPE